MIAVADLIDHQHAAAGLLHDALHGTLGVAPEGADEAAAVAHDDVAQGEGSGLAQERAEDLADGRLARAGIAQEDAVEGDGVGLGAGHEARELAVESREGGPWKRIPEGIWLATMRCYPRFIAEHRRSYGRDGFDRGNWTVRQAGCRLFRIGELEYELFERNGTWRIRRHILRMKPLKRS